MARFFSDMPAPTRVMMSQLILSRLRGSTLSYRITQEQLNTVIVLPGARASAQSTVLHSLQILYIISNQIS